MSVATKPRVQKSATKRSVDPKKLDSTLPQKPPLKQSLHKVIDGMRPLVEPFGWTVDHRALSEMTDKHLKEIELWLQIASDEDPLTPEVFWRAVEIPYDQQIFSSVNNVRAVVSIVLNSRDSFGSVLDMAPFRIVNLFTESIPQNGVNTFAGAVFAETDPFCVWFGRKAAKQPDLSGEPGASAIASLFRRSRLPAPMATEMPGKCRICGYKAEDSQQPGGDGSVNRRGWLRVDLCQQCGPQRENRQATAELRTVAVDQIVPAQANHRKIFDQTELEQLADSIRQHGILQPLLLRPRPDAFPPFEIVAGERRWRAAQLVGLHDVPAQIVELGGLQASLAMLEENIRRVDLSPIERAYAIRTLMGEHRLTQQEVGKIIGVRQGQVSNELRLLNLPAVWQERLENREIAPTLVRPLLPYCDIPGLLESISIDVDEGETLDEFEIRERLKLAIKSNSRSMQFDENWMPFSDPNPKRRHFKKCSAADKQALKPRTIELLNVWEGQERTFELEVFDRLNAKPLAERQALYEAEQSRRKKASGNTRRKKASGNNGKKIPAEQPSRLIESECDLRIAVCNQLRSALADALQGSRDKANVLRVCLTMLTCQEGELHDELLGTRAFSTEMVQPVLDKLSGTSCEMQELLRSACVAVLRTEFGPIQAVDCHLYADALGADLLESWTPNRDVLDSLTDAGLRECLKSVELADVNRAENIKNLQAMWQQGFVPDFLIPFVGRPGKD